MAAQLEACNVKKDARAATSVVRSQETNILECCQWLYPRVAMAHL